MLGQRLTQLEKKVAELEARPNNEPITILKGAICPAVLAEQILEQVKLFLKARPLL